MSPRIRVLVIQNDCAKLISLMLWLEQFSEFEIAGVADDTHNLQEQLVQNEPDVLLIDAESMSPERLKCLKKLRAFPNAPALVIIGESSYSDHLFSQESDLHLNQATSVNELCDSLRKANNRRRQVFVTANMPLTKAG
jgi:DNA-binding NarL/FixJ family response regulator